MKLPVPHRDTGSITGGEDTSTAEISREMKVIKMKNKCLSSRSLAGFGSESADLVIAPSFQCWSVWTQVCSLLTMSTTLIKLREG